MKGLYVRLSSFFLTLPATAAFLVEPKPRPRSPTPASATRLFAAVAPLAISSERMNRLRLSSSQCSVKVRRLQVGRRS